MADKRDQIRAINRNAIKRNFEQKSTTENAVDLAVKNAESDISASEASVIMQKPAVNDTPVKTAAESQEVVIKPKVKEKRKQTKLLYLTDTAATNMKRVSKEYGISANELVNQLLEQLR